VSFVEVSVTNQAFIFLSSVIGGLIIGFVFDVFRIFRRVVKTANIVIGLQDILFWILVSIILFGLIFITNNGELRWYEFLGVILGVIFYNLIFSMYVMKVSVAAINLIKKVLLLIIKILLYPFAMIYKLLKKPLLILRKSFYRLRTSLRKFMRRVKGKIYISVKNLKVMLKKI